MALTPESLVSPFGPLRRETFRDPSEAVFTQRVTYLLQKAAAVVAGKTAAVSPKSDDAVEALALALAFEQAAGIWAGLPKEESVAGEVSFAYDGAKALRAEAERYFERYAAELAQLGDVPLPSRVGRLRRT